MTNIVRIIQLKYLEFSATNMLLSIIYFVVSGAEPVRNVSWILFQEGRSSELRLRRRVGQAAHTLNNHQVGCTGVLL